MLRSHKKNHQKVMLWFNYLNFFIIIDDNFDLCFSKIGVANISSSQEDSSEGEASAVNGMFIDIILTKF